MKPKIKNSKIDLIWIIPEILAGLGFIIASILVLKNSPTEPIWEFIFLVGIVIVVLGEGVSWLNKGVKNLMEIYQ